MSWEWSHTVDAYQNARDQVQTLARPELLTILREWSYHDREESGKLRSRPGHKRPAGFRLPNGLRRLDTDTLADLVWERAEGHRTCDRGGWNAHVCPYGCHTVPFDPPADREAEL